MEKDNKSDRDSLLNKIINKHNEEMAGKENVEFLYSQESLDLVFEEVRKVKRILKEFIESVKSNASSYNVFFRDNRFHIGDVILDTDCMLVQFYQEYGNMAKDSYLLFSTFSGLFDSNGLADPFYPPSQKEIIRLTFSKNNDGSLGWRDKANNSRFYTSEELTDIWLNKFFRKILK